MTKITRVYLFKRFERFWHWSQAGLIIFMAVTGFEIHGDYLILGFDRAVQWHTTAAWILIYLWLFAIFWHLTTGEWKQYVPIREKYSAMLRFYIIGIFKHEEHPFRPSLSSKLNPLQKLSYLFVKLILAPAIWITGLLYLFYNDWVTWGIGFLSLELVALVHTFAAFCILMFLVIHLYLITTGRTPLSQLKAMITGWEEIDVSE